MAYLILAAAYFLIGSIGASWLAPVRNAVPLSLFVGFILILPALGISLVKPCVVGTTARASKENVRSIGYSIYYTIVNIGGALGPIIAWLVRKQLGLGIVVIEITDLKRSEAEMAQARDAARQNVDETAILYRQGLAKAIELVDANDSRFTAEVNYAVAQYSMAEAYLNLRQAMGLDPLGTELK